MAMARTSTCDTGTTHLSPNSESAPTLARGVWGRCSWRSSARRPRPVGGEGHVVRCAEHGADNDRSDPRNVAFRCTDAQIRLRWRSMTAAPRQPAECGAIDTQNCVWSGALRCFDVFPGTTCWHRQARAVVETPSCRGARAAVCFPSGSRTSESTRGGIRDQFVQDQHRLCCGASA